MKDYETGLTQEKLKSMLQYDAETGIFKWLPGRSKWHRHHGVAGTAEKKGYISTTIEGHRFKVHRLAWLYTFGVWPTNQIDHRDGDKGNNRLNNLREATGTQNARNKPITPRSSHQFRGATRHGSKWVAAIYYEGKRHYLGRFVTPEEAAAVYDKKARELFGEFYAPLCLSPTFTGG